MAPHSVGRILIISDWFGGHITKQITIDKKVFASLLIFVGKNDQQTVAHFRPEMS